MTPQIIIVRETASTNSDMLAMASDGAQEGLWLRAESQTMGRGRMGREWESPVGNLYASTLVRLRPGDPAASTLALVAAAAAHDAIDAHVPHKVRIKWPNDILAGPAKLCGMLLERKDDAVVIGIGINITGYPKGLDRPVTSLWALGSVECDAQSVLLSLADHFARWLLAWRDEGLGPIRDAWLARAHASGTPLVANLPDGSRVEGRFDTLGDDGALILCLANGQGRAIHAADIFLI